MKRLTSSLAPLVISRLCQVWRVLQGPILLDTKTTDMLHHLVLQMEQLFHRLGLTKGLLFHSGSEHKVNEIRILLSLLLMLRLELMVFVCVCVYMGNHEEFSPVLVRSETKLVEEEKRERWIWRKQNQKKK